MLLLSRSFNPAFRSASPLQGRFDTAYAAYARSEPAWVAAMLDRHLLEGCVLRDKLLDPQRIALRWALSVCPLSATTGLLHEAEQAATVFTRQFQALGSARELGV